MKCLNLLLLLALGGPAPAQKIEQLLTHNLKADTITPYYYGTLEKTGTRWHRELYYLPEGTQAMGGDFLDSAAQLPDGEHQWFDRKRHLEHMEYYRAGVRHGPWLRFSADGLLTDSMYYHNGWRKGTALRWNNKGQVVDSSWFDGAGNGRVLSFFEPGKIWYTGSYVRDTARNGRWTYYYTNGQVQSEVQFAEGKVVSCQCFTETGAPGDPALCKEQDAEFTGGQKAWARYLQQNLQAPNTLRRGTYTVLYRFVVNTDGTLSDFECLTQNPREAQQEVLRLLKKSPRWEPAIQFGRYVKAYRTQPVTFMISE